MRCASIFYGRINEMIPNLLLLLILEGFAYADVKGTWGTTSEITYPSNGSPPTHKNGVNWGQTREVDLTNDQSAPTHKGMAPAFGVTSVMTYSGDTKKQEAFINPDYYRCGLNCLDEMPKEKARRAFEGAKPTLDKIITLIHSSGDREKTLELLGDFCTQQEIKRKGGVTEQQCASRYFESHRFWYEFVKRALSKR